MRQSTIEADFHENIKPIIDASSDISPPVVAIGGLLTVKRLSFWYKPLLDRDDTTDLPAEKRFIAPPEQGIGHPNELQKKFFELLEKVHERLDYRKLHLVGHSLGGLLAFMAGLERPDLVAAVDSHGGVHDGYSLETPATQALRRALGNPEEAVHLRHDSAFMQEQRERRASEWQPDIPVRIVATPLDQLIIPPRGFDIQLPPGQTPEKRILAGPKLFAVINWGVRKGLHIPDDVLPLRTTRPTEHLYLPRDPAVINYTYGSREATASHLTEVVGEASDILLAA